MIADNLARVAPALVDRFTSDMIDKEGHTIKMKRLALPLLLLAGTGLALPAALYAQAMPTNLLPDPQETDEDADRITLAAEEAERTQKPVAVLVGSEFGA